ncbi:MAG: Phosphoglycolate phosphatase [Akkermansiaceae bacterium]|nr:Phosphoglycolate phosphatase [Akkermansiaceae bacterium]
MTRGLIFDLDGTLVDSLPGITASLNHGLKSQGYPGHVDADVRRFIGDGTLELSRRSLPPGVPLDRAVDVEADFKVHYDTHWPEGTKPYAGVTECVVALAAAGYRLAVLSNKTHAFTVEIVEKLFPGVPFTPVYGQRVGVARKPDPEGALLIAKEWGLDPRDCSFIGDSTVDCETGTRAGMRFIGVTWGYNDRELLAAKGATLLVDSVAELQARLLAEAA